MIDHNVSGGNYRLLINGEDAGITSEFSGIKAGNSEYGKPIFLATVYLLETDFKSLNKVFVTERLPGVVGGSDNFRITGLRHIDHIQISTSGPGCGGRIISIKYPSVRELAYQIPGIRDAQKIKLEIEFNSFDISDEPSIAQ